MDFHFSKEALLQFALLTLCILFHLHLYGPMIPIILTRPYINHHRAIDYIIWMRVHLCLRVPVSGDLLITVTKDKGLTLGDDWIHFNKHKKCWTYPEYNEQEVNKDQFWKK